MKVFEFQNYKVFLKQYIESISKSGRGMGLKIARFLRVHPTMISQVINGDKHFSPEHAHRICEFFGFTEDETRYFVTMVLADRAGSVDLRKYFETQLIELKEKSSKSVSQIKKHKKLNEEEAGRFYSSWKYSATRLLTSLPAISSAEEIADYMAISPREVGQILRFLLDVGLIEEKNGRYEITDKVTFLTSDSPYYPLHHANWRVRAIDACSERRKSDFTFTSPMTLSHKDFDKIREDFLEQIKAISERVVASPGEVLACLNIDFFKLERER